MRHAAQYAALVFPQPGSPVMSSGIWSLIASSSVMSSAGAAWYRCASRHCRDGESLIGGGTGNPESGAWTAGSFSWLFPMFCQIRKIPQQPVGQLVIRELAQLLEHRVVAGQVMVAEP